MVTESRNNTESVSTSTQEKQISKKKPLYKRPLIIILVIVALIISGRSITRMINEAKAVAIVEKNGNKEEVTAKEIMKQFRENEVRAKNKYIGANITFVGTVRSIESGFYQNGSSVMVDCIEFKEGWDVYLCHGMMTPILMEMEPGTKVKVESNIYYVSSAEIGGSVDIRGMEPGSIGYTVDSLTNNTKLTIVE